MFSSTTSHLILALLMLTTIVISKAEGQDDDCQCDSTCYYRRCSNSVTCYCREKFSHQKSIIHSNSTMRQEKSMYIWSCPCRQCIPKWYAKMASNISITKHHIEILRSNIFRHRVRGENLNAIKTLDLSNNKLIEIQDGAFSGLGSLESLQLFDNGLEFIPQSAFKDIPTLKILNMSQNLVQNLTFQQFQQLPLLEYLDLSKCKISEIMPSTFHGLKFLKELMLNRNRLTFLNENTFSGLVSVKVLDLSDNQIVSMEKGALVGMPLLNFVDFENNHMNFTWQNGFGDKTDEFSEFDAAVAGEDRNDSDIEHNNTYPCNCYKDGTNCLGVWSFDESDLKLKCVNVQTQVFRTVEYVTTGVASVAEYGKSLGLLIIEGIPKVIDFILQLFMFFYLGATGVLIVSGIYDMVME